MPPSPPAGPLALAQVWVAAGLGLAALVVAGRSLMGAGDPPEALGLAGAIFAAIIAIVLWTVRRHHPHRRFGAANHVTLVRVVLTSLVGSALLLPVERRVAWWVLGLTLAAVALDGVDGLLARRTRLQSAFGARFDMEVDTLLILVLSILVWRFDKAGGWIVVAGLLRYVFVVAGLLFRWLGAPLSPTLRGKTVAVVQFVALAVALAPPVPPSAGRAAAAASLALLVWSFAVDIRRLWRGRDRTASHGPVGSPERVEQQRHERVHLHERRP